MEVMVILVCTHLVAGVVGFFAGVLFWRNNSKSISAQAQDLARRV